MLLVAVVLFNARIASFLITRLSTQVRMSLGWEGLLAPLLV